MSVCILHRDGWALCDSRGNVDGNGIAPGKIKKVFQSQGSLVSVVGHAIIQQRLQTLAESMTAPELPPAISEWMFDNKDDVNGEVLLVNSMRQLLRIDSSGFIADIEELEYWAIGCAADRVLGYLDRVAEEKGRVGVEDAEKAVVRASLFDSGIDGRVQVYRLV